MLNRILLVLAAGLFFGAVATVSAEPQTQPATTGKTAVQPQTGAVTPEQQKQIEQANAAAANAQAAAQQATTATQKAADEATKAATQAADQANKAAQQAIDAAKATQQTSQQIQQQQQNRARLGENLQRQAVTIKATGQQNQNAAAANNAVAPSDRIEKK